MAGRSISYELLIDWDNSGNFSFDESDYLFSATGNESMSPPGESSFSGDSYASEMNLTLLNKGARFTSTNSSSLIYAYIANGAFYQKKVKLSVTLGGTTHVIFRGFIKGINEKFRTVEEGGKVVLTCRSDDDQIKFKGVSTSVSITYNYYVESQDEGTIIAKILETSGLVDTVHYRSQAQSNPTIDRGLFSIPYFWMDKESPIEDASMLAQACGGRFFFNTEDGYYYYRNAFEFATGVGGTSQATLTETNCSSFGYSANDDEMFESVTITARPRYITEIKEIWRNDDVIRLAPGEVKQIHAKLNQPLIQYENTSFVATTTAGLPISGITSSVAAYSQRLVITLTNTSAYSVFIRDFYATGRLLEALDSIEYSNSSSDTYWNTRDGKEKQITANAYVQSWAQAKAIADIIVDRQGSFSPVIKADGYVGTSFLRVGDRVTVTITGRISSVQHIITRQNWTLSDKGFNQSFELYEATGIYGLSIGSYFIIGTHSQNSAKSYFY